MEQVIMSASRRDRGFVLFMTLVMLVVITLSGLAMMQVMGAGVTAAGNIAFRQASVHYADLALEDARAWLQAQTAANLVNDSPANGYTSFYDSNFDPKSLEWQNANVAHQYSATDNGGTDPNLDGDSDPTTFSGYRIYYVIHRMAVVAGQPCTVPATGCMIPPPSGGAGGVVAPGTSQSLGTGYNPTILGATGNVYYRVTAKVVGPRHNSSYVQAIMH